VIVYNTNTIMLTVSYSAVLLMRQNKRIWPGPTFFNRKFCRIPRASSQNSAAHPDLMFV